jgi:hypothetical protein
VYEGVHSLDLNRFFSKTYETEKKMQNFKETECNVVTQGRLWWRVLVNTVLDEKCGILCPKVVASSPDEVDFFQLA